MGAPFANSVIGSAWSESRTDRDRSQGCAAVNSARRAVWLPTRAQYALQCCENDAETVAETAARHGRALSIGAFEVTAPVRGNRRSTDLGAWQSSRPTPGRGCCSQPA